MKKYLLAVLLFVACKKESSTPTPPINIAAKVSIETATITDHGGFNYLDLKLKFDNSAGLTKCDILIYKTDILGPSYRYHIVMKDGEQILSCNKYADASPMNYRYEYFLKDGTNKYSEMLTQTFN